MRQFPGKARQEGGVQTGNRLPGFESWSLTMIIQLYCLA